MSFEILNRALSELEVTLAESNVKVIVGGGFGLYLLQCDLQESSVRTIIERDAWCMARSTSDIDIILETSIIANLEQFRAIRSGLDHLDYKVKPGAAYMHFEKSYFDAGRVEINFLTGPIEDPSVTKDIQIKGPRVRPKGAVQLHAYLTPEVFALSDHIQAISNRGNLYVPSGITFLIMKLHAFKDRFQKNDQEKAAHHAMDTYRVISMMTEAQFNESKSLLQRKSESTVCSSTSEVVEKYFAHNLPGVLKIREHPLYRREFELETFCSVLEELFRPFVSKPEHPIA